MSKAMIMLNMALLIAELPQARSPTGLRGERCWWICSVHRAAVQPPPRLVLIDLAMLYG